MFNIKYGDKVAEYCTVDKCKAYPYIVALSNLAELKGAIKCPKQFCDRMKLGVITCSNCGNTVHVFEGYYDKDKFYCFRCDKKEEGPKIEDKKEINNQTIDDKMKILKEFLEDKSSKFVFENYFSIDEKQQKIVIHNPMNTSHLPLVWDFTYMQITDTSKLKKEMGEFFKSFFDQFKEDKCSGCKLEEHKHAHMTCIDCSRNPSSAAMIKKDRFVPL